MNILLTGAAGFVGHQLLASLKQKGCFVRAVVRTNMSPLADDDDPGSEIVVENLTQATDFKALLADIDTVIHLADGFNTFEHLPVSANNEEAAERLKTTMALINAAALNGTRFIYLSTIKAVCGSCADHVLDEATPPRPQSLYGALKQQAEQAIMKTSRQHGSKAVVLRFPVVFGPGAGGNMEKLRRLADNPLPLPLPVGDNRRSLISSRSLIDAINSIVSQQQAPPDIYLVHDGAISTTDMIRLIREGLGRPQRQFEIPTASWSLIEKLPFVGQKTLRFTRSLELDDHHFRTTFNWQSPQRLQKSLIEWAANETPRK